METRLEARLISGKDRIQALKEYGVSNIPIVCTERAVLLTESYKESENEPMVIRRAKALDHILSNMGIGIGNGEVIVGDYIEAPGRRGSPLLIEYYVDWLEDELDVLAEREVDKFFISEENKKILRGLMSYWKGKGTKAKAFSLMPEELRAKYVECLPVCHTEISLEQGLAHIVVDFEKVITRGLGSVINEVREHLKEMDSGDPVQLERIHFYRAVLITLDAVIRFAARYANLAKALERKEQDSQRKMELREIAEICAHVPAKPARTFHEALQSVMFTQIALLNEAPGWVFAPGRMDQYLFPFYKKDIEEGRLSREKAKELLKCYFINQNLLYIAIKASVAKYFAGIVGGAITILGGMGRDGRDATNELSYLMLEMDEELGMPQPESVIRVHKGTPRDFLIKACQVSKKLRGKLKFINDEIAVQKMLHQGYTIEDARDYILVGCHEPCVPKKTHYLTAGQMNLALCFELALNNGVSRLSGKQLGPQTGDPREFKSIEDVLKAYRAQVAYFAEHLARADNASVAAHAQWAPTPFQSSLVQGCLEKGVDITAGGALYNVTWASGVGVVNVGDSLAAIKKCVFDEGKITMKELIDALDRNFEGREEICQALLEAPKFGNDDDYVDLLTKEAVSVWCEEWQKLKIRGIWQGIAALNANTANISLGRSIGATPDGRKSGESLADGGVSPAHGRNVRGPVATYKSVAKLDHIKLKCGSVLNMKFNPDVLKDDRAIQKFATMLQTYFDLGGYHVQFNIISTDMLRDAQKNPEKYRDLLVRVSTWTAYFTELSTEVQNDIIERSELT